jgi:uncharacterized phage-like protein YoqJ
MARTVCFTGHRHIPDHLYLPLRNALETAIEEQIMLGADRFLAGGALGFDTLAALTVLLMRRKYPHIRLELILPCPQQTKGWAENDVALYEQILEQADHYSYISTSYYAGVLQLRNCALVEKSQVCIAYLTNSHGGGTAFTAAHALKNGLELINLNDVLEI